MKQNLNDIALKYLRYGETLDNDSSETIYALYGKPFLPYYKAKVYHFFNSKEFAVKVAKQYYKEFMGLLELPKKAMKDIQEGKLENWLEKGYDVILE